jgi:hypothetical protein
MIKEAIKYVLDLHTRPEDRVVRIEDSRGEERVLSYDNGGVAKEIKPLDNKAKESLSINTLTGLVAYVKSNLERANNPLFLQVADEKTIYLKGKLDDEGERETLVTVTAITPRIEFDRFLETEQLIIALQAKFVPTNDRDILLKVIGNVKEDNVRQTGDSGIAQVVTIKTGIASADNVIVPNPVALAPYRTFVEVEQPVSDFIFRMKDGPVGAIFEADGGMWRNDAITNIQKYLAAQLETEIIANRITILA